MTPVEPDPVRTGEGSEAVGESSALVGDRARSGPAPRARAGGHAAALDEPRDLAARPRPPRVLRPLARQGAARHARRRRDREPAARGRGDDRRRRTRAGDGAPAGAARPPRLVPRDGPERAAVLRLGDLRADRDREGRRPALRQAVRVRGDLVLDAALRRADDGARAARADRLRPPLRPQARDLGRRRVARLPDLVDPRRRGRARRLVGQGPPRLVLGRGRHRDRGDRLLGAARRRLHALLARPAQRVLRGRRRLLPADAVPVRLRLRARPLARARPRPPGADPGRDRRRRCRRRARAARADGGRDRRGVREHVLGRGLAPEPVPRGLAAVPDPRLVRRRDRRRTRGSTCAATRRSCSCSARSSCPCSAS